MTDRQSRRGRVHQAGDGDSVENLSYAAGFHWSTVWNHPRNAALKKKRAVPDQLVPGDEVYIPEAHEKTLSAETGQSHRFRLRGVPSYLHLVLRDGGKPREGVPYALEVDGKIMQGVTKEDGVVRHWLMPDARTARLRVGEGISAEIFTLRLRRLQPVTETAGIQARLQSLGFGTDLETAVRRFQESRGLQITEAITEEFRRKLQEEFGC